MLINNVDVPLTMKNRLIAATAFKKLLSNRNVPLGVSLTQIVAIYSSQSNNCIQMKIKICFFYQIL
jgi:hypothetical protein